MVSPYALGSYSEVFLSTLGVTVTPFLDKSLPKSGKNNDCFDLHRGKEEEYGVSYPYVDLLTGEPRLSSSWLVLGCQHEFFLKYFLELYFCRKERYEDFLIGIEALF